MKVLVTGATGFLGFRILKHLQQSGHEVVGTGRNLDKGKEIEASGSEFRPGDLENKNTVREITHGVNAIIHSAALSSPWGHYEAFYRANVLVTEHIIDACRYHHISRLVHISTPSIYFGFHDRFNIAEDDPLPASFANFYAETKYKAEKIVDSAAKNGLETITLRPRAIIGAGDTTIMPRLMRAHREGKLRIIGNGTNIIDTAAVANVADATLLALTAPPKALGKSYNITNADPIYLWKMVENTLSRLNLSLNKQKIPFPIAYAIASGMETAAKLTPQFKEPPLTRYSVGVLAKSQTLNIDRARNLLGYKPRQKTMEAIDEFIQWWQNESR